MDALPDHLADDNLHHLIVVVSSLYRLSVELHHMFLCVMSHLVGLDSDMISEIPRLGVEVLANPRLNEPRTCRRNRRVQRAGDP